MQRKHLRNAAFSVLAVAGLSALGAGVALAADVSLDNVSVKSSRPDQTVVIKHLDAKNSSLSADDLRKLVSGELAPKDEAALAAKFSADSVTIPEIDATGPKGGATIHDVVATGVAAGKIAKLDVAGADIVAKDGDSQGGGKAGKLHVEGIDLSSSLAAMQGGAQGLAGARVSDLKFDGLDATFPDAQTPKGAPGGNLAHLVVGAVTAHRDYDGDYPTKGTFDVADAKITFPPASKAGASLKAFGYDAFEVKMHGEGACTKADKACHLDGFKVDWPGAIALAFSGDFGNVTTPDPAGGKDAQMKAMMAETIGALGIRIDNSGFVEKALAFAAAQKHTNAAALKGQLMQMTAMIPMMLGDPETGKKLGDAVSAFLAAPKNLSVTVKAKGAPVAIGDLKSISSPAQALAKFSLDAQANQ
ncbi:MAG: hypothetical protein KGI57_07025 [Hyphomicrobiales bacterium]|nr:hypothetical protein [Hyphomicrobiales bacterium]MDE2017439.1 hypothetical protein [Hyphomicrobiales bacterium]